MIEASNARQRVHVLGSGTCRIDSSRAQTSACVIADEITLVIDIGHGALERLDRVGAFDNCSELHIHISHRHIDHVVGLFPLLQCLTWSDDHKHRAVRRVVIHATEEVCTLVDGIRTLWGKEETSLDDGTIASRGRILDYQPGPNFRDWTYSAGSIQVSSIHLPGVNNHGALCELSGKRYGFTCDATELNEDLISFCQRSDFCVFDFGHFTNIRQPDGSATINLEPVVELLARANPPVARAAHVYLRHLQERRISAAQREDEMTHLVDHVRGLAQARGFTGAFMLARDCEVVSV